MPTSCIGGPEKTLVYRCSNSSPRYSVRTTMPFLIHYLKVSQVSKYEISITLLLFSNMSWKELPLTNCKFTKKS